jgi:hypothetical protein
MAMARAGDVTGLTNEPAPLDTDVLLLEKAADGTKRKVPVSAVGGDALPEDYQRIESLAESSTDLSTPQTKVQLVTGALTGTYRIGYGAKVNNNDKRGYARLYNVTDASVFGSPHTNRVKDSGENYPTISGVYEIVLTGVSKTIELQYYDDVGGDTQYIKDAFIEFWKVGN